MPNHIQNKIIIRVKKFQKLKMLIITSILEKLFLVQLLTLRCDNAVYGRGFDFKESVSAA